MNNPADKRLIEDYIPIKAIQCGSQPREVDSSWAHQHFAFMVGAASLVAARAAVFGALVPAGRTLEERPRSMT